MNKRFQELAELATSRTETVDDYNLQTVIHTTFSKKKFAELIVIECSQISRDHQRNYYESHGDRIAKKIKEHFGVEE